MDKVKTRKKENKEIVFIREGYKVQTAGSGNRQGNIRYHFISRIVLVFLFSFANLIAFQTAFALETDLFLTAIAGIAAAAAVGFGFYKKRGGHIWLAVVVFVTVIGILWNIDSLVNGFSIVGNKIISALEVYYNTSLGYQFTVKQHWEWQQDIQKLLLTVHVLFSMYMMLLNRRRIWLLPSILPSVAILVLILNIGQAPAGWAVFLYTAAVFYILILHNGCRNGRMLARLNEWKYCMLTAVVIVAVFLTSVLWESEPYQNQKLEEWKEQINWFVNNMTWERFAELFSKQGAVVAATQEQSVKLGETDEIEFDGDTMLIVRVPKGSERDYYLKGWIGVAYADNTWKTDTYESAEDIKMLSDNGMATLWKSSETLHTLKEAAGSKIKSIYETSIEVTNVGHEDSAVFMPEYAEGIDSALEIKDDKIPILQGASPTLSYFVFGTDDYAATFGLVKKNEIELPVRGIAQWEKQYNAYVRQAYLQLPEEGLEEFRKEFSDITLQVDGKVYELDGNEQEIAKTIGLQPYIDYVTDYLKNMDYTLSPGACPEGTDFVEDFLFHKKKGYCVHFATAATLMFRQMGIPARYVTGYIVEQELFRSVPGENDKVANVPDKNAHAWVEIYEENTGWIPVEVTVGFGGDMTEETTTPKQQTQTTTTKKNTETTTVKKTTERAKTTTKTAENQTTSDKSITIPWKWLLLGLAVSLLPVAVWYGGSYYRKSRLAPGKRAANPVRLQRLVYKLLTEKDIRLTATMSNKEVLQCFSTYWDAAVIRQLEELQELFDRSFYSEYGLVTEQAAALEQATDELCRLAEPKLHPWKRFLMRYVWCIH